MLIHDLIRQANDLYNTRDAEIAELSTKSDWLDRQALVREKLAKLVGLFPEKTPLHPRITGVLHKDGYRVEKLIYESMPEFYVTGCLFIPDDMDGEVPAALNVIGHNQDAFSAELYQKVYLNLVKKGIMVLAIDPVGQGEHVQYYDSLLDFSSIGYSVIEHCFLGNQCFLSGVSPCSWSTASRRQLETQGVQDAETVFISGVTEGITFEDLLEVRAPKPTLLTFVSRDQYLSIQGARESFREAKKAYAIFGSEDQLALVEDDFEHWMTPLIRSKIYAFFMEHFDLPGDPAEEEVDLLSAAELTVTPTGQISTSVGGDMVFDVNERETERLIQDLEKSREDLATHLKAVMVSAKHISGYTVSEAPACEPFFNGRYRRESYTVGKYAVKGEGEYVIPLLLFVPDGISVRHPAVVYLHPEGKAAEAMPGGEIEKLVKKGYIVAAVGETCLPLIHAAAFDTSIANVILIGLPISYRSIAMDRFYRVGLIEREGRGTERI